MSRYITSNENVYNICWAILYELQKFGFLSTCTAIILL